MALSFVVDGQLISAEASDNLLSAALKAQLDIPYFCWHPALGAVGSCRQCAVKVFQSPDDSKGQIVMACMTKPGPDMRISVDDSEVVKFRAGVVEMALTNHPHDCPVCEVAGECHLQDMAVLTGHHQRRYNFPKRTHLNQNLGPFIRHEMNRCIGCFRCVRFYRDYAGGDDFGVFGANRNIYFGRAEDGPLESNFAGNLVEVCPTGVFVDKPFSANFRRKWDLRATPSICPHCAVGCNITVHERGGQFRRVTNRYNQTLNGYFLCDRGRFGTGFLSSPSRLRHNHDRAGHVLIGPSARSRLADIFKDGTLIGIGSPRASVESNFVLRELVGKENFYAGLSALDAAVLGTALSIMRQIRPATLEQIEQADAYLVIGDDPALVAPRVALALRQAARQHYENGTSQIPAPAHINPFMVATVAPSSLDNISARLEETSPREFATALLHQLQQEPPNSATATKLLAAAQPVIVAGGDPALLATAANIVLSLRRSGVNAKLSLLLPEVNSTGLGLLDCRDLNAAANASHGRHLIILERDITHEPSEAEIIFSSAKSVTVLDHIITDTVTTVDLSIAVASFAESDGIMINLEGRAQSFFKAIFSLDDAPASWEVLRDAAIDGGRLDTGQWQTHVSLLHAIGREIPELMSCVAAWPDTSARRTVTLSHRHSGRTAATAHLDVHEPLPPQHPDSAFGTTMEGDTTALPWAPGWNSAQVLQRLPNPRAVDVFLFEDDEFASIDCPGQTFTDSRHLGIEELSQLSPAIIAYQKAKRS